MHYVYVGGVRVLNLIYLEIENQFLANGKHISYEIDDEDGMGCLYNSIQFSLFTNLGPLRGNRKIAHRRINNMHNK